MRVPPTFPYAFRHYIEAPYLDEYEAFIEFLTELQALQILIISGYTGKPFDFESADDSTIPTRHIDALLQALWWPSTPATATLDVQPPTSSSSIYSGTSGICPQLTGIRFQGLTLRLQLLERMVGSRRQEGMGYGLRTIESVLENVDLNIGSFTENGGDLEWLKGMEDKNVITRSSLFDDSE